MRKNEDTFRNYTRLAPIEVNVTPDKKTGYQLQESCNSGGKTFCYINVRKLKINQFCFFNTFILYLKTPTPKKKQLKLNTIYKKA